jgi:hypothetical protein
VAAPVGLQLKREGVVVVVVPGNERKIWNDLFTSSFIFSGKQLDLWFPRRCQLPYFPVTFSGIHPKNELSHAEVVCTFLQDSSFIIIQTLLLTLNMWRLGLRMLQMALSSLNLSLLFSHFFN